MNFFLIKIMLKKYEGGGKDWREKNSAQAENSSIKKEILKVNSFHFFAQCKLQMELDDKTPGHLY